MAEILILEDDEELPYIFTITLESLLPKQKVLLGTTFRIVQTSRQFLDYLQDGGQAGLYFLDDRVPKDSGCPIDPFFLIHYHALLTHNPEARVFYTGGAPTCETETFCLGKGVPLIQKEQVPALAVKTLLEYHHPFSLTPKN